MPSLPPDASVYPERRLLDASLQRFIAGLLDTDAHASAIEQYAIEQLVMEMSGALVLDRVGGVTGQGTPHEVLRERAIAVIAQQCGDPSLNPARVARECSRRCASCSWCSPGEQQRGGRDPATAGPPGALLLMDSRYDVLSIDQIAQRAGFQSPMSLRRALDESYSATPRALRSARRA